MRMKEVTMEKHFIRAKSPENKQIRMNEIMKATEHLFYTHTYHDISLTTIANELNMTRGNLYKYVHSKEEIFLQIYLNKQKEVIDTMVAKLQEIPNLTISSLAHIMTDILETRLDYIQYHQILNAIIETNVSIEKLADFKIQTFHGNAPLYQIIKETCHLDTLEQATHLYLTIIYHCCYLYDRVAYHDSYTQAMKLVKLPIIPIDFNQSLYQFITMCLSHYYE